MKLYQALKYKNKLVGEIKELEQLIQQKNSNLVGNENPFDLKLTSVDLALKRDEMVTLKVNINKANLPVVTKIFTLSELKAAHAFWSHLNTRKGKVNEGYGAAVPSEYTATFDEVEVLSRKKDIQKQIEKTQDELDQYNHTTDI